ncbi:MAG TPA: (Fe-S)-binding protein [Gaiellaceae bacterium]|nr:(Fe-S)-binding protein [Gaiellaceae bacterium]
MALPTGAVIGILGDNLRLRGSVLPIPERDVTRWTEGLDLDRGGATVLYTGQMYQLMPYIERLVKAEQRLGDSPLVRLNGLGRRINRIVSVAAFLGRPPLREREEAARVPRAVAALLREAGVRFGSLFEDDLYSGALAYDLGLDAAVAVQARRVYERLRGNGVRLAITIDPHTTHMLRTVYPRVLPAWDIEVRSYLEILAKRAGAARPVHGEVVLHDSCLLARAEGVVDEPRRLLAGAGFAVLAPQQSGTLTWCCGGPAESLYPEKALAQAQRRVAQLRVEGTECVTMCPLCLVNLSKAAAGELAFRDISELLLEARTTASA